MACQQGSVDAARLLLVKGADVSRAQNQGTTPLAIAKSKGHSAVVALLEEHRKCTLLNAGDADQCVACGNQLRAPARNAGGGAPTFDVRLPPNARPGVTIMARAPNGRNVRLTVPHGVPPGGTITVRY